MNRRPGWEARADARRAASRATDALNRHYPRPDPAVPTNGRPCACLLCQQTTDASGNDRPEPRPYAGPQYYWVQAKDEGRAS